ncbi:restriction endonuclease subunit S [Anaerobacillus sp. 1_MG-2023]|uniref:restriction endonuclease subunit S n=1 Tax=Anaerobacillus sp. 1_MG-2023 TaxID=3062655 RepID=UPI0026E4096A|nr:restriction endonuclease subunit S [Anaerobacillus sp. 1_MG-2023]MDO6654995.1 restriction endonuclease subunit S [Anaerobacillus sp. 1_MG-2023]
MIKTNLRSLIDSQENWLKEIPSYWKVKKIKWLTSIKRGASPRPIDDPKFFDEKGEYAWVRISDVTKSKMYLENTTQRMSEIGSKLSVKLNEENIFLSIAGSVGKPCISKIKCCIHDGFVYFPEYKENIKFLYYIFESGEPYKGLGKFGTQLNLNTETVGSIKIGLPPRDEQDKITAFLDKKTTEIDDLIEDKERLIKLLEEKRQAVITEAVTKGLDPNVKMKDSGVEWIGGIPEHWELNRLGTITDKLSNGYVGPTRNILRDSGVRYLQSLHIKKGNILFNKKPYYVDELWSKKQKKSKLKKGDLVIVQTGDIGQCAVITSEYDNTNCHALIIVRLKNHTGYGEYLNWYFQSNYGFFSLISYRTGALHPHLDPGRIKNLKILLPPKEEQLVIVEYLKSTVNYHESLIYTQREIINKLKEYRQSLIYEAVTGKIDVRGMMALIEQEEVSSS